MNNQPLPELSNSEINVIIECIRNRQNKFFVGDSVYNKLNNIIIKLNQLKQP
jgi:hypothetical protein|tara:strand:- start:406 stop:561 length:156 start_codon:yes stop_codon:yes gene_type:complete